MTGRNWFFTALARHAREHGGDLREWLNEAGTAARCQAAVIRFDDQFQMPHPDGAGTWAEDGQAASFLLEYDTGTEHRKDDDPRRLVHWPGRLGFGFPEPIRPGCGKARRRRASRKSSGCYAT